MKDILYLVLENGRIFKGSALGAQEDAIGEIVFTTAMTGYNETLTDPSYCGQIVVQTFPLIGNCGVIPEDFESAKPALKAYIAKNFCDEPSNFRCGGRLADFLKRHGITALCGIDTRELTRILRERGTMNGKITADISDIDSILCELKQYRVEHTVEQVSTDEIKCYRPQHSEYSVVLWDFGAKDNIRRELMKRGCSVTVVPYNTPFEKIAALKPDGIMLSNGPGDPSDNKGVINELKKLPHYKIPTFGICLGHQLLALSQGAETTKLKYGHRGANQPVKDMVTGQIYITSQNHGYAVVKETLPQNAKSRFLNVNDATSEGIDYTDMPAFSVQFHPEACGGPQDTGFLFDRFSELMKGAK